MAIFSRRKPSSRGDHNSEDTMLVETKSYLGPARVLDVVDSHVRVQLPDREEWAILAMGSYQPAQGDVVLAIGGETGYFVIGLIQGTGSVTITSPGDVNIIAANGVINLLSTKMLSLKSPAIRLQANRLDVTARAVFQRFTTAYTWVKDNLQLRTGRMRTTVKESYHLGADRIVEKAKKDVTIDGDSINLG
jgi:hypothetical protein